MKNKNMLLIACILLIVSVAVLGCTPTERPVPETTPNQQDMNNRTTTDNNVPSTDRMVPGDNRMLTDDRMTPNNNNMNMDTRMETDNTLDTNDGMTGDLAARADKIASEITKHNEVRSATVVITENTALVGVNLTSGTKGELNTEIKKQIEDTVKKADNKIERVSVTADPDLFTRIENIAKDIGQGRPLSGFGQEVEEIIRRITPGA